MTRAVVLVLAATCAATAMDADISGYFEPQYMGTWQSGAYRQVQSDKLRVDIESRVVENVEIGADLIGLLYFGTTTWDLLDFVPDALDSVIPEEARSVFAFRYEDRYLLDNAYVRLGGRRLAVTVGKQQLSFGTGYFVNPTDAFNTKDAVDPTYEQPGHNALRLDWQPCNRVNLTGLYAPGADWKTTTKLARAKTGLGRFDFSVTGVETRQTTTDFLTFDVTDERRRVAGADLVGQVWDVGVWAEGAWSFMEASADWYEFVVGADFSFESGLYLLAEFQHNSRGREAGDYTLNDWLGLLTGERRTISADQLYCFVRYPFNDVLSVGISGIVSVSDGSVAVVPLVEYSLFENVDLTLLANGFTGAEGKAYSGMLGQGGTLRCRAWF